MQILISKPNLIGRGCKRCKQTSKFMEQAGTRLVSHSPLAPLDSDISRTQLPIRCYACTWMAQSAFHGPPPLPFNGPGPFHGAPPPHPVGPRKRLIVACDGRLTPTSVIQMSTANFNSQAPGSTPTMAGQMASLAMWSASPGPSNP